MKETTMVAIIVCTFLLCVTTCSMQAERLTHEGKMLKTKSISIKPQ